MGRHTSIAVRMALVTMVILGVIYPFAMCGLAQVLFPRQANGSLIRERGRVIGSELIGQPFSEARYFHPRPSAAGEGYDAASSGGSNLGPTSRALLTVVSDRAKAAARQNRIPSGQGIPVDMVTASASGLDPDISLANAYAQVARVARVRRLPEVRVRELVNTTATGRTFGLLGEPRINVLRLNRALDALSHSRHAGRSGGTAK